MKIELAKVRDEFKMSESDCGSALFKVFLHWQHSLPRPNIYHQFYTKRTDYKMAFYFLLIDRHLVASDAIELQCPLFVLLFLLSHRPPQPQIIVEATNLYKHSRKGLQAIVQKRKKLFKYLRRTDKDSYCFLLSKLGLRDTSDSNNNSNRSVEDLAQDKAKFAIGPVSSKVDVMDISRVDGIDRWHPSRSKQINEVIELQVGTMNLEAGVVELGITNNREEDAINGCIEKDQVMSSSVERKEAIVIGCGLEEERRLLDSSTVDGLGERGEDVSLEGVHIVS
ncbi:30S ribosomal protein S15 [Hibiscus syriacus]|uniref:30S ribosomal protein S15 n=1 Tax=Hibiscus syriacus TaxID=106335 RepID=A0A6A2XM31_HIBSY|nr:30S ribosomal protein S15 [Hibiscus syriacus]